MDIKEACQKWVGEWNAVRTGMIFESMLMHPEDWTDITIRNEDDENSVPTWGWMWSMDDSSDEYWILEKGGIEAMSELGLIVFSHDEYGIWFGVDAGGFDFYEAFWIPLYKARGLQWHDKEEEDA